MKIGLINQNGQYGFAIVSKNNGMVIFNSFHHYPIVPFVSAQYKYAWKAQKDANKLLREYSHHLKYAKDDLTKPIITDISAEEMLKNHYMEIYDGIEDEAHSSRGDTVEGRQKTYQGIKKVVKELGIIYNQIENSEDKKDIRHILILYKKLIKRYFNDLDIKDKEKDALAPTTPLTPLIQPSMPDTQGDLPPLMASVINTESRFIGDEAKTELMEDYGERACRAIQDKHNGAHYKINNSDKDTLIIFDKDNSPILVVGINDKLNINRIIPIGKLYKIYPYHTVDFYQKYWKPIIEEIGHFYFEDITALIVPSFSPLPDVSNKSGSEIIDGWNTKDRKINQIEVSFRGDSWFLDCAKVEKPSGNNNNTSKYTEQDYINAMVKCIDSKLKSIFGRTGTVIQIIPHSDFIEIDVNFGRGIDVVRLTEKQIEIISV